MKHTRGKLVYKNGSAVGKEIADIKTYGNIWTRHLKLNKIGDTKKGHKHDFDHLHFVAKGKVLISAYDNKDRTNLIFQKEYSAGSWIKVPKEHFHDIKALEDNTEGYCIQALLTRDNEVPDTNYALDDDWMREVEEFEKINGCKDETIKED